MVSSHPPLCPVCILAVRQNKRLWVGEVEPSCRDLGGKSVIYHQALEDLLQNVTLFSIVNCAKL